MPMRYPIPHHRHWLCIACKAAHVDPPPCQHHMDHIQVMVDTEQWLWWRWRLLRKPIADQRAIATAGGGLRRDQWDRVKDALKQKADEDGHEFVIG